MLSSQFAQSSKGYGHFSDLGVQIALSHRHVEFFVSGGGGSIFIFIRGAVQRDKSVYLYACYVDFHSLEVVDRVSETQLQVGENSDRFV